MIKIKSLFGKTEEKLLSEKDLERAGFNTFPVNSFEVNSFEWKRKPDEGIKDGSIKFK